MMTNILAAAEPVRTFIRPSFVGLLVFIFCGFIFALIIISLIRMARYFISSKKEQKLIRMELSKLAEEVQLIRKEIREAADK